MDKKNKQKTYSAHKKNLDNIKLLFSDDDFKKMLKEIRDRLEIYHGDFKENPESFKDWYEKIIKESDKISSSKEFRLKEREIIENLKSKEINKKEARKQTHILYEEMPINYLYFRVDFIIKKFNLPENYGKHIRDYLLLGKIDAPFKNYSLGPFSKKIPLSQYNHVPVTVYAKLIDKDLKEMKKSVNSFGEKFLQNYEPLKDIDRNTKLEESYKTREYSDESDSYKISLRELAEEHLRSSKKEKDVYETVRKLRILRNKRFKKNSEKS